MLRHRRWLSSGLATALLLVGLGAMPVAADSVAADPVESSPSASQTNGPKEPVSSASATPSTSASPSETPAVQDDAPDAEPEPDSSTSAGPSETKGPSKQSTESEEAAEEENELLKAAELASTPLQCEAGHIYGLTGTGQLRHARPDGTVASIGVPARGVSSFNGLGVGANGDPVFAYERGTSSGTAASALAVWQYAPTTGEWTNTGKTIDSNASRRTVQFVGGAVNLKNGRFYVGGFNANGSRFRVWEYNPATGATAYKGEVNTAAGASNSSNGDIDFDALGNMYIVRGVGSTTTVFSVTAADFAAASGGTIAGSLSKSVTTMSNVNGVAFDSDGRAFLGAGEELRSYAMPGWTNRQSVTSNLGGSTDLASCSSPPNITIEKVIEGGRVKTDDQFNLTLKQGGSTVGEATTTGTKPGLQAEHIGPVPTVRGARLQFEETGAGATNLDEYATSYRCEVDGALVPNASGEGRRGEITIPDSGSSVVCRFHNAPLLSKVNITKTVLDYEGANPEAGKDWTVGAEPDATTGNVNGSPVASSQQTNDDGQAGWELRFDTAKARATVTVSETQQPGYEFVSGSCEVVSLDGSSRTVELAHEDATAVPDVAPGDQVDCGYVNKVAGAELTLEKDLETRFDPDAGTEQWVLSADGPTSGISGVTGEASVTAVDAAPGRYSLAEALAAEYESKADGYETVSLVCNDSETGTDASASLDAPTLTLDPGAKVTCVFTNRDLPGSAEWLKVDGGTGDALAGSEWTLTGPGHPDGLAVTGNDAGEFTVDDLMWGDYELLETKAPTGYKRSDAIHELTVGPGSSNGLAIDLGSLENEPQDPLTLPLTGGVGSLPYWLGGGLLAALALVTAWWKSRRGGAAAVRR
ncbi:SpaA isopeptide-forming pilin-related protein [Arthrobacter rhombi]|uniref:SpaA isopeptide-forming pilin-related protein n=1 Tax=Arthrobacter rhombi TaxID=71253 RepID=UPI003FCFC7B4